MSETVVYRSIPRPAKSLIDSLRGIPVADLHDEMSPLDRKQRLMSASLRPVFPGATFIGPAVTAFNTPGDNLMMHTALFLAEAGDVLVLSNGGVEAGALFGDNAVIQAQRKGVVALVADGPIRDTDGIRRLQFPAYSTSISVSKPSKAMPGTVNVPIVCAGVMVRPGDIVVGDSDGVIVIPPSEVERIVAAAKARIERDKAMHVAIAGGSTLFQELGGEEALKKVGAVIHDGHWPGA
jgi:4-hydroxy-4-methyl-2-oxoglutarate aldolase